MMQEAHAPAPDAGIDRDAIAAEARDLSDWMRQPLPETGARRQAREASMRAMAARLMSGHQED